MTPRHRVLIVGVGSIGERHLRCFAATGKARVSICEPNAALRQSVAQRYEVPETFEQLDAALASRPNAVVIAAPAHVHIPLARAAVDSGAHVLIEKPLSTSCDGVNELLALINRRGVASAAAYVYRAHPALAAMRAAILSGRFGEPVQVVAKCGQNFPFYRPAYRDTYYKDRAMGGGAVQDALTHTINAAEWLVGPIERLVADIDHKVIAGVDVEDTVHVLARHGSVMGCYSLNQHQAPNETTITVICREGTARFEYHQSRWRWMTAPGADWTNEDSQPLERDTLFIRQAESFLASIEGLGDPLCDLPAARQTLCVNLAILRSAETGQWEETAEICSPERTRA